MKFALLHERKITGDRRVLFSPKQLAKIIEDYPQFQFVVESSPTRCFTDKEYEEKGIEVCKNIKDCDVFFGIKEVPLEYIIEGKTYFFFSHTTKMQSHNKSYLEGLQAKKITFFDYENFINASGKRLVAFGKNAGKIGTYHAIRTYGLKERIFKLPKPSSYKNCSELINAITPVPIPPIKIVVTGNGNVGQGVSAFLDAIGIRKVTPIHFLNNSYSQPVYCQLKKSEYLIPVNNTCYPKEAATIKYTSDFMKFATQADIFIAGHYFEKGMPLFFTKENLKNPAFKIRTIADISCDILEPLPTTLRVSTPKNPIYGYDTFTGKEVDYQLPNNIAVMAVDNLPCELPQAASIDFGNQFIDQILPDLLDNFENSILVAAKVLDKGIFTKKFNYLEDFIQNKVYSLNE